MEIYYRMPEGGGAAIACEHPTAAKEWNQKGFGIFWTIHEFDGERKKENLKTLNGFAIDIDGEKKDEAMVTLKKGLFPTWVIETKSGFHLYWLFKNPMQISYSEELDARYKSTMVDRLIPFYGADKKAADLARLLRVPFFLHQKNPKEPFMITVAYENPVRYDWNQIDSFFPDVTSDRQFDAHKAVAIRELKLKTKGDTLFKKIWALDCEKALERLSGDASVGGEQFTFRRNASGTLNIYVNRKSTSCWIDVEKRIGSADKGGPTIWQWLYWYSGDHKRVYEIVKQKFPEVFCE